MNPLNLIKKICSYFFPVTQRLPTDFSGTVELTWYNGKKILNSKNANYSYDSLQRLLKFGLTKIDITPVKSILLLGLGGGSVIKTLADDFGFKGHLTAVELDQSIIEIAKREFQVMPSGNLDIIHGNAADFVERTAANYDLIIVDLFIDDRVPEIFFGKEFWQAIARIVSPGGYFIFNASATGNNNAVPPRLRLEWEKHFTIMQYGLVENTNTLVIGMKMDHKVK